MCGVSGESVEKLTRKRGKKSCFFPVFTVFAHFREGIIIFMSVLTIFIDFTKKITIHTNSDLNISGKT
jgi:hypothetical protein